MPKEYYTKDTPTTYMAQIHVPYAGKMTANDLGEVVKFLRDQATWIELHLIHLDPGFLGHQCSLGCQADPEEGDPENQPKTKPVKPEEPPAYKTNFIQTL